MTVSCASTGEKHERQRCSNIRSHRALRAHDRRRARGARRRARLGLCAGRAQRRRQVVARPLPVGPAETAAGQRRALRRGRVGAPHDAHAAHRRRHRGCGCAAGDERRRDRALLLAAVPEMGPGQRRGAPADVRRSADEPFRESVERTEEAGLAGDGAGHLPPAARPRRSNPRARRRRAQVAVRGSDRRSGRPRHDHLHHHARSGRRRNVCRPRRDDGERTTRARRRRRRAQVAFPPHPFCRAAGGDRYGRAPADRDAQLGRRRGSDRQQLRRRLVRTDTQQQQHRSDGSRGDVPRRDFRRHRRRSQVMKTALVIAAREFEEKRFVAYAAVAFAILPFILAAIPGISGKSPADVLTISALIFGTTVAMAVGVISGASFIGRDLSDGRMSFYFSRPVGSLSIWFGKLTAGILMIAGTFGLIILPARLAAGDRWTLLVSTATNWSIFYILAAAVALFLIAHVISTFGRSRSPLMVFDFIAAVVCGVVVRMLIVSLLSGAAVKIVSGLLIALGIAAAVAVIGGGAWQLERGRTDRRRNHLALSQFLWTTAAVALLIAAAYVAWVVSMKPSDLTGHVRGTRSTSGPFAVLVGTGKGRSDYHAAFLLNSDDGSATRVSPWAEWSVEYTPDGRSAVLPRRAGDVAEIMVYTRGKSEPVDTGLTMTAGGFIVSDDGSRIATITPPNTLSIYDVAQRRSLAAVLLPDAAYRRAIFITNDVVRLYLNQRDGIKIAELDVRVRGLHETGSTPSADALRIHLDPSAAHMLIGSVKHDVLTLNDARTGAAIRTLATGTRFQAARYLRDGRIVFIDGAGSALVLHVLQSDGTPQRDVPLGGRQPMFIGDDGARVVLTGVIAGKQMLAAINIDRGAVEHHEQIGFWVPAGAMETRPPIEPLRDVFYAGDDGRIVAWNPATGAKRAITGG